MKVILREEVGSLGNAGDLVNVKDGYARNFLIPRNLAIRADERNVKELEHARRALLARRTKLQDAAQAMAAPSSSTAATNRATRSLGAKGASQAKVATHGHWGWFTAAHSIPVSTPANGPANPPDSSLITSAMTGKP